jgi:hypothetical protein
MPLVTRERRWGDDIIKDLREIARRSTGCIELSQDIILWRAFVSTIMNLAVP